MKESGDVMTKSLIIRSFVLLTISLTRYSHVAGDEIEIIAYGVRPVTTRASHTRGNGRISGAGGGSSSESSELGIANGPRRGPVMPGLPNGGSTPPEGSWHGGMEGGSGENGLPNNIGGLGGVESGIGGRGIEGGGIGGIPSGIGSGGLYGSASGEIGGLTGGLRGGINGRAGQPSQPMFPGLRGMGNDFGGGSFSGAGMRSGSFGDAGFGGLGGEGNSVEEGRSPSVPRVGPSGGFSGEAGQPPRTSFGGHGGSGFGGGHLGGAGFDGGHFSGGNFGGGYSRTTSSGGYGWTNMPSRGPPPLGMPGGGTGRLSSGETREEEAEGEGNEGRGAGGGALSSRRRPFESLFNPLRNLARGAIGSVTNDLAGTGLRLLQGTRAGRRLERRGRRFMTRLSRRADSLRRTLGQRRRKRSIPLNVKLPSAAISSSIVDGVPDHVKMVHCGRHEVPNRGHHRDRFCHPETTWKNVRRLRPDCVCAPGYLRNSWGDCISYAECHHCMNKHHMNMDYNLCESQCPLVCNQPIDTNCPDTCYEECACRPGYIRSRPNGPCISIHQCLPGCPSPKQYFTLCRSSCPATCANPYPSNCPKYCAGEGCVCKPGYLALTLEPLRCVRPEQCPGFHRRCHGANQVYTTCKSRCPPTCWGDKEPRMCTAQCAGSGCVCKPGFMIGSWSPLTCVHPAQCAMFNQTSHLMHIELLKA
ncbi:uncharacterized protein LOC119165736 isoform X2 [Rhipicephalus microplus]|uniref:uncharacterized protein LOC119165736 isoform X2 n=1 Tax=Rhipicephalus microplus TaxID=6941 RepID=UPI003F6D5ECE